MIKWLKSLVEFEEAPMKYSISLFGREIAQSQTRESAENFVEDDMDKTSIYREHYQIVKRCTGDGN
jgi:hypothetical protein